MVLEQEVVLVSGTTNSSENIALHEIVDITAKAIDNLFMLVLDFDNGWATFTS